MSKVKEHYMKMQEEEFELDLSYQEWLMENIQEPSESEINEMEEQFLWNSSNRCNRILSDIALNNTDYNPIGEEL